MIRRSSLAQKIHKETGRRRLPVVIFWEIFYISIMIILLMIYYSIGSFLWSRVICSIFGLKEKLSYIFGFLVCFYLSSFSIAIPIVLWKYDEFSVFLAMIFCLLLSFVFAYFFSLQNEPSYFGVFSENFKKLFFSLNFDYFKSALSRFFEKFLKDRIVFLFFVLLSIFVFLLFHARTGTYILSPHDALSSFALMIFFGLCFLCLKIIFSSRSAIFSVFIVIIFSYASHAYLPVIYETGFGGDKWRHLAAEKWLQEGNIYTPSVFGERPVSMIKMGPLIIPEALVAGNKTSYAAQWGATIMLSDAFGVDLFWVDLLLVFALWSLFLPLILFLFGKIIFENERLGAFLAFLPIMFYTFQSEGAITIPVSFGHLFFFFVLFCWMFYVKTGSKRSLYFSAFLSIAFYWGYILNFFLLLIIGALSFYFRRFFVEKKHWYKLKLKYGFSDRRIILRDKTIFYFLFVGLVFAIPFLEIFQGLSYYSKGSFSFMGVVDAFADSFGLLSGFVGVIVPPNFIDQGNFLYNQTKESLSRVLIFSYRVVPFFVSVFVWTFVFVPVYYSLRKKKNISERISKDDLFLGFWKEDKFCSVYIFELLAFLFILCLFSYFISWSFLDGVHILARRLNETIAFFMVLFFGFGIWIFLLDDRIKIPRRKKFLAICFLVSFASTSTYASGPKLQVVTSDQVSAARFVWEHHRTDGPNYCVLANTWPLLALEAESGKRIVAGNFPLYAEYAQPERVKIFDLMSKTPEKILISQALKLTGADVCYYMNERRWAMDGALDKTAEMFGEPKIIGSVFVWRIEKEDLD